MITLVRRVARTVRARGLYVPTDRVAVALSGGPDSVALAWIVTELASRGGAALAGVIHVNHQLRGRESDDDEQFCVALAARAGWPIECVRVDAAADARTRRVSIEAAARGARYRALHDAAGRLGATVVATGHTLDDQAETVLLRLLRGAGTRGLSGIRPRWGRIVRPVIDCRRADLRRALEARGEAFREDSSNLTLAIPRNRIRHDVLPRLEAIAPGCTAALARCAAHSADDERFFLDAAIKHRPAIVLSSSDGSTPGPAAITVSAARLASLPPAIGRRLIRDVASDVAPQAALSTRHIEAVWALARADRPGGHVDLPKLVADRQGDHLTLAGRWPTGGSRGRREQGAHRGTVHPLDLPGTVTLPESGVTIAAGVGNPGDFRAGPGSNGAVVLLQAGAVNPPLEVRYWRPGDRFRPLGAPGRRKLQDVFVDRKVPRAERHLVPVVVDRQGRILWVAGVALAEECRVTAPEAGVVILEMRKPQ